MSNNLRTRNGMPFNFVNGLKVRGMDIESLIPGIEGIPEAGSKYQFAGNGSNKAFTLPVSPYNKDAVDVYVKQLYVHPDDYTLVGDTITLTEAPPALVAGETYNVVIKVNLTTLNGYVNASRVSFEGDNLDVILQKSKPLANYPTLRAYAGAATQVRITDSGIAGFFYYDAADTTSADNGGTIIVSANGRRWKRLFDGAVNVRWFGAKGDWNGTTGADDTVAIQAALDSSASQVVFGQGTFKITDTVVCPSGVSIDFNTGILSYAGTRDRSALQIGEPTASVNRLSLEGVRIVSSTIDWTNTNYVGLRVYSSTRSKIHITLISGFTIGFECYSASGGYAYNYHEITELVDNKYALALTCDGAYPGDFANENIFMGGRYGNSSSSSARGSAYGIWFRSINGGYQNHNMNRWFSPCFELQDGVLGDERIPFFFDNCGTKNSCYSARHESGRGAFAKIDGTTYAVQENNFEVSALGGSYIASGIDQIGLSKDNFYWPVAKQDIAQRQSISYDVISAVKAYNSTTASISGGLCFGTSTGGSTLLSTAGGVTFCRNSVRLLNRSIGFFAQVNGGDQFYLYSLTDASGTKGRVGVAVYDANFIQLTNASVTYPDAVGLTYSTAYGGIYWTGTDSNKASFRLSSAVKYIRVFAASGSNPCYLQSITLTRTNGSNAPLRCFNNIGVSSNAMFAGADPNTGIHGIYGRGDILQNALAASGQPSYWQCVTAGRLAPVWAPSTVYDVGTIVLNDTNKIYACVTAGTSAGSGGPTGTGTNVVDGTSAWEYISPLAVFIAGTNLP